MTSRPAPPPCLPLLRATFADAAAASHAKSGILPRCLQARRPILTHPIKNNSLSFTHRVAISNHRITDFDGEKVTFSWKDYAHDSKQGQMTLEGTEILRRFFSHVLPKGFVRIRQFGFLANRFRAERIELCRELIGTHVEPSPASEEPVPDPELPEPTSWRCPLCGAPMIKVRIFRAGDWSSQGDLSDEKLCSAA